MRAQTTIDFVIGIVIFLGVIVFAFSFVPGILQPFELSDDEAPALSDRIADSLSQEKLGSAENPHVLDRYCTVEFFDDETPPECNYDEEELEDIFDLELQHNVNVTLVGNVTAGESEARQLCWSDDESGLDDGECDDSDDVTLAKGDEVPDGQGTVITARRVVSLDGQSALMEVRLW